MALFPTLGVVSETLATDGPAHMAQDELLLATARDRSLPVFRSYGWYGPAVTFGYFLACREVQEAFPEYRLTRRWTGGGAVVHGDPCEFTYALAIPSESPFAQLRAATSYKQLHECLTRALRAGGIPAAIVGDGDAKMGGQACFQAPVVGDVILKASGQKLAGAAQRRTREGLLVQGSVRLPEAIPSGMREGLIQELCSEAVAISASPDAEVSALVEARYGHPEWLDRK